jgi:hypothetical protein
VSTVSKGLAAGDLATCALSADDERFGRLLNQLPKPIRSCVRSLLQPSARWIRIPVGVLLICGGIAGFLPVLGFWMLPIGVALLAEDVPILRSVRSRILKWVERRHPRWLSPEGSDGKCCERSDG